MERETDSFNFFHGQNCFVMRGDRNQNEKTISPFFARPKNILGYCFQGVYRANINESYARK